MCLALTLIISINHVFQYYFQYANVCNNLFENTDTPHCCSITCTCRPIHRNLPVYNTYYHLI